MEQLCEYNFQCEDYAIDGSWREWAYRVSDNAPAKHKIIFMNNGTEFTYLVCDGCLAGLKSSIENDEGLKLFSVDRISPQTKAYNGTRKTKTYSTHQPWTEKEREDFFKKLRQRVIIT